MATYNKSDIEGAYFHARRNLAPGTRVYTILRHVSRSGMQRHISLYTFKAEDTGKIWPVPLTSATCIILGLPISEHLGWTTAKVTGCGMDMGFDLVYCLSHALYPDGFIPALAGLPGRNGTDPNEKDPDGGYALQHAWL